jgi:hypothetical protein
MQPEPNGKAQHIHHRKPRPAEHQDGGDEVVLCGFAGFVIH